MKVTRGEKGEIQRREGGTCLAEGEAGGGGWEMLAGWKEAVGESKTTKKGKYIW